jgi:hypothetical protein
MVHCLVRECGCDGCREDGGCLMESLTWNGVKQ